MGLKGFIIGQNFRQLHFGTPHALNPSSRSFTDDMLKTVANTNGIVGINLEGVKETPEGYANDMVRRIEYLVDKLGDRHVGFGSDMLQSSNDGGMIKTLLSEIIILLAAKKYTQQTIDRIAYTNWQRVLNEKL